MKNKIETLRELLESSDGSLLPKAENLAEEICKDYLGGKDVPSGLEPLPLIINYTHGLLILTEEVNSLIEGARQ